MLRISSHLRFNKYFQSRFHSFERGEQIPLIDKINKFKDPLLVISSLLGGIGIFGGLIAFAVGDRVSLTERLQKEKDLRIKDIEKEKELRIKDIEKEKELRIKDTEKEKELRIKDIEKLNELRESDRRSFQSSLESERELRKVHNDLTEATIKTELLAKILDYGFHSDYETLRKELFYQSKNEIPKSSSS